MRSNYWSNSRFSRWVRTTFGAVEKPKAATVDEWDDFRTKSKKETPFVHWFTDEFLDDVQNAVCWPKDKLESFSYWVYNRFIEPTHIIRTGLKKGQFHETEEKILYGIFSEVVDFVEIQKASMGSWGRKKTLMERITPYFIRQILPFRNQQQGINHLLWEVELKKDDEWFGYSWREDKDQVEIDKANNPEYTTPTPQAEKALRILDAYCWWKFVRPMRKDPMDASGYTEYFNELKDKGVSLFAESRDESYRARGRACYEETERIETQYFDEDTFYLKEIIEIRAGLWT